MSQLLRLLVLVALLCGPSIACAEIRLIADSATGDLVFWNSGFVAQSLSFYSIESTSEALLPDDWTPVAGRLDLAAGGEFDSVANWLVLSTPGDNSEIAEGAFSGSGGELAAGEFVVLGAAWDSFAAQDLYATAIVDDVVTIAPVVYSPEGDYDWDGDVDIDDYSVYAQTYASTTDLRADGSNNGVIDAGDYTIWRDALSLTPAAAVAAISLPQIPEPTSVAILFSLIASWQVVSCRSQL